MQTQERFAAGTLAIIKALAVRQFGVEPAVMESATTLKGAGLDSLDIVDLLFAVEKEFGIELPDAELRDVTTLSGLAEVTDRHIAAGA